VFKESNIASQQAFGEAVNSIRGVQISRSGDDQFAERWGSSDQVGMLSQLGLA